ncbi:hypothetical protein M2H09_23230 [Vibrio vulnificus]|uniref:hypothetical protein n=1 Tax=Vibrio vulnificus TaxID=672 RepID=UPI001302CDC1|nr:hypothetical protein [Vibrio vulnificus]MCU8208205.1 hypothetical protein [Vibrio vulnificus]
MNSIRSIINRINLPSGVSIGFTKPLRMREKLRILNVGRIQKKYLKKVLYHEPVLIRDTSVAPAIKTIDLENLIGINRQEGYLNWVQALGSLQKGINFDLLRKHGLPSFEQFVLNGSTVTLPQVIKKDGKYYVEGDGKHRLTLAKCCGLKRAQVEVVVAQ